MKQKALIYHLYLTKQSIFGDVILLQIYIQTIKTAQPLTNEKYFHAVKYISGTLKVRIGKPSSKRHL